MLVPHNSIIEQLRKTLSPALYRHCSGVAETAGELAAQTGCSEAKARLAGWLHDCAREWPDDKLLRYAGEKGIEADKIAQSHPVLLHAPVGAAQASAWGITDHEVLSAIRNHTLGSPRMSLLEQIIYVADKIEPGRNYPGVTELRNLVRQDFHAGLVQAASHSIRYILNKKQPLHPVTVSFWNWLVESSKEV